MRRTTSFGFGVRVDVGSRHQAPPPNTYTLPSVFDTFRKKGHVFSFGVPSSVSPASPRKPNVPGPGTYDVIKEPGRDASKFTFRKKCSEACISLYL
jgi:hypothetical protein